MLLILVKIFPTIKTPELTPGFQWGSCYLIFSYMCNVLQIIVCPFVHFLLVLVFSVLPRFMDSDYPFGIFKLFFSKYILLFISNNGISESCIINIKILLHIYKYTKHTVPTINSIFIECTSIMYRLQIAYTTNLISENTYTVTPVLRGHLWDKTKVVFQDR